MSRAVERWLFAVVSIDPSPTGIYTLSLHDALPISMTCKGRMSEDLLAITDLEGRPLNDRRASSELAMHLLVYRERPEINADRKSTRLNSSHSSISYAVFCLKKKT